MKAMNIFNPKKALLAIAVAAIGLTGCEKFLDVNTNPNNPDSASPTLLLPASQAATAQIVGNTFQIYGNIWGQYWTQSPSSSQYRTLDQYNTSNTTSNTAWLIIYRNALENAQLIINSKGNSIEHTRGMAYIMKAYTYQVATDAFGDIPLSQALQGNTFGSPKYDTQELVYDSIFTFIDKGIAALNATNQASPGTQDMVFQGNATKWKAFANTLKLRAYLRIAKANPTKAQAGVAALYSSGAAFLTEDASIKYTSTGGNENPLYNEIASPTLNKVQNIVASETAVKAMKSNNDPRLLKLYDVLPPADTIAYIRQGAYATNATKRVSPPSALVGGKATDIASATAPVKLMSASESYFLQAEAAVRGWGTGVAATLYAQGVTASFTALGLTAAQATTYLATAPDGAAALATATDLEGRLKAIITQKYYAMNGFQGFEAWTEWRRTGYPTFFTISAANTLGAGRWPLRVIYPNSELTSNLNFPGSIPIYTPVWWDK